MDLDMCSHTLMLNRSLDPKGHHCFVDGAEPSQYGPGWVGPGILMCGVVVVEDG